jgi:hypothetical protein
MKKPTENRKLSLRSKSKDGSQKKKSPIPMTISRKNPDSKVSQNQNKKKKNKSMDILPKEQNCITNRTRSQKKDVNTKRTRSKNKEAIDKSKVASNIVSKTKKKKKNTSRKDISIEEKLDLNKGKRSNKRKAKDNSQNKSNKKRKGLNSENLGNRLDSDSDDSSIDRELGWPQYSEMINKLCAKQNLELESTNSKAKTGSSFSSLKKEEAIISFLEASTKSDNLDPIKGKHNWRYTFRLIKIGKSVKVQKPSFEYNRKCSEKSKKNKLKLNVANKFKEMVDTDWTDLLACDTMDFFRMLNNIH